MSPSLRTVFALVWVALLAVAVYATWWGLDALFYFEGTDEALAHAEDGRQALALGVLVLFAAAVADAALTGRVWVAAATAGPGVVIGFLVLAAEETLFPQLAGLVAVPFWAAAGIGGLIGQLTPRRASSRVSVRGRRVSL